MIFSPKQARRIAAGRKTQERRPITRATVRLNDGRLVDRPSHYRVGHDYPVRTGHGQSAELRIKITAIRFEAVGAITLEDARAEGYRTTDEFKIAWVRTHDEAWIDRHKVDLAEVFDDDDVSVVDWILLERFRRSHAHRRVRVLVFDVLRDLSRYMATQRDILSGRSDGDYTSNPHRAIDDAECPSPAYAARAREDGERRRETFRSDLEEERSQRKQARVQALRRAA